MMFERLYEVTEKSQVHFIGVATERARYDFSIVYTDHFFGKPLVICMQTGRSSLLDAEDINQLETLQRIFNIRDVEEASELSMFLNQKLPAMPMKEQY
jgi:hypothetical protein